MHKSILKIILILYIFLQICHVESEEVFDEITYGVINGEFNFSTIDTSNEGKSSIDVASNEGKSSTDVNSNEERSTDDTSKGGKSSVYDDVLTNHTGYEAKSTAVVVEPVKTTTILEGPETTTFIHSHYETKPVTIIETEKPSNNPVKSEKVTPVITTPPPTPIIKEVQPTPDKVNNPKKEENKEEKEDKESENKIAPVTATPTNEYHGNEDLRIDNNEGPLGNVENDNKNNGLFGSKIGTVVIFVGTVSIGLIAVSGYQVYKRKNEKGLKQQKYINHNISHSSLSHTSLTPSDLSENNQRASIAQSLILEESQNQAFDLYYSAKSLEEKENPQRDVRIVNMDTLTYQSPKPRPQSQISIESAVSKEASIDRSTLDRNSLGRNSNRSTISRNSIIRHSFLNPNIRIVRTGKRTQQLFEATNDHPAIIETFPSMERPYEPVVPVPLEESDTNSLHPHSIYQMYQDEMEFENYYAYTIDDKEYIIDPTTNRVLEIHDLTTDEYVLVEEELYLDFSGSDDSDSDKQTL